MDIVLESITYAPNNISNSYYNVMMEVILNEIEKDATLLESVMKVEVIVETTYNGDVMTDLTGRRRGNVTSFFITRKPKNQNNMRIKFSYFCFHRNMDDWKKIMCV